MEASPLGCQQELGGMGHESRSYKCWRNLGRPLCRVGILKRRYKYCVYMQASGKKMCLRAYAGDFQTRKCVRKIKSWSI